jgi:hypothetical protein
MSEELMSLEEIDRLCNVVKSDLGYGLHDGTSLYSLRETARAAHSLKAKLDQSAAALSWIGSAINGTHPELAKSDLRRTPVYEDALALKAENEKLRSELESANNNMLCMRQEVEDLRAVFEAARRALRYCGVWKVKFNEAMSQLYLACEAVKAADAGNGDEM